MPALPRRTFFTSTAVIGAGILAGCASSPEPAPDNSSPMPTTPAPAETQGSGLTPQGDLYGVGVYNTQQVADELAYIEATIEPLTGDGKRVLITGSTAGIGQLAAAYFLRQGHSVVAHARNEQRAAEVRRDLPPLRTSSSATY